MGDPINTQHFERPQPGWQLLSPGIYVDQQENMHVFPGDVLSAAGWADTEENRETLMGVLPGMVRERYGKDIPAWLTEAGARAKKL